VGLLLFVSQWWTIRRIEPGSPYRALGWLYGGFIGRFALVTLFLSLTLQNGVLSALVAFIGLLVSRWALLVWVDAKFSKR